VRATARRAWKWTPEPVEGYIVTVENLSSEATVGLERVSFDRVAEVEAWNDEKPMPAGLSPGDKWEGWIAADEVPGDRLDVGHLAHVRLSGGREITSRPRPGISGIVGLAGVAVTSREASSKNSSKFQKFA
jgi:hypothetical protein